jgi:hypothetical protein
MLVLICACILTCNQSYASVNSFYPGSKSSKSVRAHTTQNKARNVKKNKRLRGYNYYKYANTQAYLRSMGKAINGCR